MIRRLLQRIHQLRHPGHCPWCERTVSSGLPTYPHCSEECQAADWQSMSAY